jgi:hypothetical protein
MSEEKHDLDDLPELPDTAELLELPELPDELPELPELPDELPEVAELDEASSLPETELPELPTEPELPEPVAETPAIPEVPELVDLPDPEPVVVEDADPLVVLEDPLDSEPEAEAAPVEELAAPEPEAPVEPAVVAAATAASVNEDAPPAPEAAGDAPAPTAPGERPPLRELDKAPKHLALASKVVVGAALLPFMRAEHMAAEGSMWMSFVAKLFFIAAAWLWYQQVLHNWSPTLKGFLGKLAGFHLKLKKEDEDKKKRSRRGQKTAAVEHPFPTGLHLLAIALIVAAFVVSVNDPRGSLIGPVGPAEAGMLGWAAFTFVHIANYERWGNFNPLFPLMFLAMLLAGFASVFAGFGASGIDMAFHVAGGLGVGLGGGLAAYTIVEAMMQAKKEGDRKKAEAIEARKAARKSKRN